jgi:MFS family permease
MPLYLTFALMLFCFASISSARVVLSLYALHLGGQPFAVGALVATFYLFPLVLSWPIGILSDRAGSRGLLLFGTVCGAGGMAIPYFVRDLPALYVAGTMIGISFSFYNVLLQNLVGLLSKPHERVRNFSNSSLIGAFTNFAGPLLVGFSIDHWGHAVACLYVASLSLVAAVLVSVWGGVLPGGTRNAAPAASFREILADKGMLRILVISGLAQVGQDLYQFYIPVYGYAIGLSASAIGSVIAAFAMAAFVVRFVMPGLILRVGEERVLVYSFALAAAGFLLVPFFTLTIALAIISFVFGLGMGCCQPITTALLFSRSAEGRSGEILGLRQSVNNIMRVSGPPLFGLIASAFGLPPVFWLSALIMAAGGWITRPEAGRKER